MSQKMMISWLENGIKNSLKIPIQRPMKLLSESARTTEAFLKIAKDEQELEEEEFQHVINTILYAILCKYRINNITTNVSKHSHPSRTITSYDSKNTHQQGENFKAPATTIYYEEISEDEQTMNYEQNEPAHDTQMKVHVRDELIEVISDGELPEIMKRHFKYGQNYQHESLYDKNDNVVHVQNELPTGTEIISDDDEQKLMMKNHREHSTQNKPLTRNQKNNRKKRAS